MGAIAFVALAGLGVVLHYQRTPPPRNIGPSSAGGAMPFVAKQYAGRKRARSAMQTEKTRKLVGIEAATPPLGPRTSAGASRVPTLDPTREALDNYKRWAQYPPSSRPAREQADHLQAHPMVSTLRALRPEGSGVVVIRQQQDRLYLVPGEVAEVTLSAEVAGAVRALVVESADLMRIDTPASPSAVAPVAKPFFRDDGVAPDDRPRDYLFRASVRPAEVALGDFAGDLMLVASVRVGSEEGTVSFPFVYTGKPPARFTGVVREAVEDGSLALYVGIDVARSGQYAAIGRLVDATGRAVAILQFNDLIDLATREIRLLAFGKVLRDEQAVAPFTLRDLQGWRMIEQGHPDRQLLEMWAGPYVTSFYDEEVFSPREWDSVGKRRRMQALARALPR